MSDLILRRKLVKFITRKLIHATFLVKHRKMKHKHLRKKALILPEFLGWKGTKINILNINCIISSFAGYRLIIRSHADARFDNRNIIDGNIVWI